MRTVPPVAACPVRPPPRAPHVVATTPQRSPPPRTAGPVMIRQHDFSLRTVSVSSVSWYFTVVVGWVLVGTPPVRGGDHRAHRPRPGLRDDRRPGRPARAAAPRPGPRPRPAGRGHVDGLRLRDHVHLGPVAGHPHGRRRLAGLGPAGAQELVEDPLQPGAVRDLHRGRLPGHRRASSAT